MSRALAELLEVMATLRGPGGCPWDRAQTFESLAPYTIEEAYEVADAVERGDLAHLRSELGDLLFQIVFHARIASEAGGFDFDAVAASIRDKLIRRHPHVFGAAAGVDGAPAPDWEALKAAERHAAALAAGRDGAGLLDDVPRSLPALARTQKLGRRAAGAGFDFPAAQGAADKVTEELAEVLEAAQGGPAQSRARRVFEEVGDLLFAVANLARKLEVDAESALRAANLKFERRVRSMEAMSRRDGADFAALDLDAQERLWQRAKREE